MTDDAGGKSALSDGLGGDARGVVAPTHRCKVCGALWRFWPRRDTGHPDSWSLRSNIAGPCCDNVWMGEQIEPLTLGGMADHLRGVGANPIDRYTIRCLYRALPLSEVEGIGEERFEAIFRHAERMHNLTPT